MSAPRRGHTMTVMGDGRVLVTGGSSIAEDAVAGGDRGATAEAELFDPASGTWQPVAPMGTPRVGHAAVLMGNGRVFVTGGWSTHPAFPTKTAELFNPGAGAWQMVEPCQQAREAPTATALEDGSVLVVGGIQAEVFEAGTATWKSAGYFDEPLSGHTATTMRDGRVLVVGGSAQAKARIFDPFSSTWQTVVGAESNRIHHAALALADGRVLVVGGVELAPDGTSRPGPAELFDPSLGRFVALPATSVARSRVTLSPLPDGRAVAVGSLTSGAVDVYDDGGWTPAAPLGLTRYGQRAVPLEGGVLITGGETPASSLGAAATVLGDARWFSP